MPGLYATGEVACSGVHGANRLASNSLLEGLVFSRRIAEVLPGELRPWAEPVVDDRAPRAWSPASVRRELQEVMTARVGVLRSAAGLAEAALLLDKLAGAARRRRSTRSRGRRPTCSRSAPRSPTPPRCARRPAGRTGARTSPSATTTAGRATSTSSMSDGETSLAFAPAAPTDRGVVSPIARTPYDALPAALVEELAAAGLDPARGLRRGRGRARGGPARRRRRHQRRDDPRRRARGTGDFAAREPGVVAGLSVAALVFAYVMGDAVEVTGRVPDGTRVQPATS